jgi:hypoxanthine phosphoribosyltransferase
LTVVIVLRGAFLFASDLVKKIKLEKVGIEFIGVGSYGNGTESSGIVDVTVPLTGSIEGKNVLILEDIVDTGHTAIFLQKLLAQKKCKSLKFASLLRKKSRLVCDVKIDYLGFDVEDVFVIGYGLDDAGQYRNLDYIGVKK